MKNPSAPPYPARRRPLPRPSRASGFTLIEVMVALIVLVLGVLGAAAMTLSALRDSKQAGLRAQAAQLAYELGDIVRMSGSDPATEAIFTGGTATSVSSCFTSGCSPAEMASTNFSGWQQRLQGVLPNGQFRVCRDASSAGLNAGTSATSAIAAFSTCDGNAASPLVVKLLWDEKNERDPNAAVTARMLVMPIAAGY